MMGKERNKEFEEAQAAVERQYEVFTSIDSKDKRKKSAAKKKLDDLHNHWRDLEAAGAKIPVKKKSSTKISRPLAQKRVRPLHTAATFPCHRTSR